MKELFITGKNLPDAYHNALLKLHSAGDEVNGDIECAMTIHIQNPLKEPMISRLAPGGPYDLQRYLMELLDGILDFEVGRNWDYTYHQRYVDHIPFIISELKKNQYSRRAAISIRDNEVDSMSDSPACLQNIHFLIRDGKLDCLVLFRSNDLVKAFFFNAFGLIMLQERIAKELGVEVGTYTHRANSMHCYQRDIKLLDAYVNRVKRDGNNLTFVYKGYYEELMQEHIPEINALVETQAKKQQSSIKSETDDLLPTEVIEMVKKMVEDDCRKRLMMQNRPKVICISGKARSGKDTAARLLKEELESDGHKVLVTHFADLLKYILTKYFSWDGKKDEVGRHLLQCVGTEVVRAKNANYWVDFIISILLFFPEKWDYVLIPDSRFPNEIYRFAEEGFDIKSIRIEREEAKLEGPKSFIKRLFSRKNSVSKLTEKQKQHSSETAMDNYKFDYVISNNGTLKDLKTAVLGFVNQYC